MSRKVFFSFHFDNDFWRTQQVRNIKALEGNGIVSANAWEEVKGKGKAAIESWIANEMKGRSCLIVLAGSQTADRPWVKYEIKKAWADKLGVVAIRIHKLLDQSSTASTAGQNPLYNLVPGNLIAKFAKIKEPAGDDSKAVYANIASNIESWIEEAIAIRLRA